MRVKIISFLLIVSLITISCNKLLDIPPPPYQIISEEVFKSEGTATSAVIGIYSQMMNQSGKFTSSDATLLSGMYADELLYFTPSDRDEFVNANISVTGETDISNSFWSPAYKYIYHANAGIEGLQNSSNINNTLKQQLIGECKFIRAFCYFYLINVFGDVPLVITTDYRTNQKLPRSSKDDIYNSIIQDLLAAKSTLPSIFSNGERIRPIRQAASALLARVYLYTGQWSSAETEASSVISDPLFNLRTNLSETFKKNSTESIWQLQPVNIDWNTWEGSEILPSSSTSPPTYILRTDLVNSFEPNDNRMASWVLTRNHLGQTYFIPYKYKEYGNGAPITEYYTVLRLAEQYLIRAEARVKLGKLTEGLQDLNIIRTRAGLPNLGISTSSSLLADIAHERKIELAFEWGHRLFDLKRTNQLTNMLMPLKPLWQQYKELWPIPTSQLNANPFLVQNPGY